MAGDWIKMTVNLPDKPEVWQIAGMLGIEADAVVGKLMRVWVWFDSHTEDGNAVGVSYPLIDRVAGVAGFAEAMAFAGWLEQQGSVLHLPKFERHNGKTAKNRALTNERVAKHRKSNDEANAARNDVSVTQSVTKTVTREEKRREEKNTPQTPKGAVRFAEFWAAWPKHERKQDKAKCSAKWAANGLDAVADEIVADVLAKKATRKWREGYIESPEVYLNNRRWEDQATDDARPDFWADAGFGNRFEAENAGCYAHNASEFRDGKRMEAA